MRSMASSAVFHFAYFHVTQQAFCYDNLRAAVKKVRCGPPVRGDGALYRVPLALGLPSGVLQSMEAHEKGGVEGEAGYFRCNHLLPMLQVRDLAGSESAPAAAVR